MSGLPKSGRGRGARPLVVGAATLGACLAAGPAAAQAFWEGFTLPPSTWSVFGGVTHTTNAARVAGGDGDTIGSVGVSGSFFRDQGRLTASVVGSVAYEEYFQDTFDGDVRASLGAQARYQLVPERVSWSVDNTFGQVATNAFAPSTPANRTNANYFSTGPDVDLRLGATGGLGLGARYARTDYEGSGLDDQRYSGNLRLYRRLSAASTVSLNASMQRIESDRDAFGFGSQDNRYDIREYFGQLEARRARYAVSLQAGLTELRDEGRTDSNPLLRATLYRRLSPALNLNLSAGTEYRNSGDILRDSIGDTRIVNGEVVFVAPGVDPGLVDAVLADLTLTNQPIEYRYARASLDWARARTSFSLSGGTSREQYQNDRLGLDRDLWDTSVGMTRRLRPNLTGSVGATYTKRDFEGQNRGDESLYGNLSLNWQVTTRLSANLGYRYEDRQSDFAVFSFQDHTVYVGVSYGPGRGNRIPGGGSP